MDDDPSYQITITFPDFGKAGANAEPIGEEAIQTAIAACLRGHSVRQARLGVAIVDDTTIADLNQTHLSHEGPTDVITFDMSDKADGQLIEGEIIMSGQTAAREAAVRGHDTADELALYAVHGVLHLLGYDDHQPEDARRMHEMEDEILTSIGFGRVYGAIHE